MRSWWSGPQSAPGLVVADCIHLLHLQLQGMQWTWFWYWPFGDLQMLSHLLCCWKRVFAMTNAFSCRIQLAFVLLHFVLQGQTCLLLQISLDFLLLHSSPLWWKGHLFWVLVLEGLVGLNRTIKLQLLWHYLSGHRLGLAWYWMICLGNQPGSF